ncbi:MAG: ParB/RepB/Spo0J family partition protein [Acholeplasmatales bacterium]
MERKQRGLRDLLKQDVHEEILEGEKIEEIELSLISPNPFQPRKHFDEEKMEELAHSIKEHGVFQPIILKKVKDGYMIVAGERRFRAAKQLNLKTIPAIVRNYDQAEVAELTLVENLQREDLNPIEEAEAYQHIMRAMELTHKQLADKIGKSRSHITNTLGLLNLPDEVKEMLFNSEISMGHARVLSKLDDPKRIKELAQRIVSQNLSVRQIEALAGEEVKTNVQKREPKPNVYLAYEREIKDHLGYKATITDKKVTIRYKDESELEEILNILLK